MPVSAGPETPTESNIGAPAGGISYWWRVIGDWIKLLSPAGASQYDTDWVSITPNTGYTSSTLAVRRIGRVVYCRGTVNRTAGVYPAAYENVFTVPAGFRTNLFIRNILPHFASSAAGSLIASLATSGVVQIAGNGNGTSDAYFNLTWTVD